MIYNNLYTYISLMFWLFSQWSLTDKLGRNGKMNLTSLWRREKHHYEEQSQIENVNGLSSRIILLNINWFLHNGWSFVISWRPWNYPSLSSAGIVVLKILNICQCFCWRWRKTRNTSKIQFGVLNFNNKNNNLKFKIEICPSGWRRLIFWLFHRVPIYCWILLEARMTHYSKYFAQLTVNWNL